METPFRRVFAPKEMLRGSARWAWVWSCLATIAFCGVLVDSVLLLDLLAHRGSVTLSSPTDARLYERLTDNTPDQPPDVDAKNELVAAELPFRQQRLNQGMRPTVWQARHRAWVGMLAWCVRNFSLLQTTNSAAGALLLSNVVLGLLAALLVLQLRNVAFRTSQVAATRLRQALHRQALRLGPSDLEDDSGDAAYLMFTGDIERVREGVQSWIERVVRYPLFLACLLLLILLTHWLVALQCLVPLLACWFLVHIVRERFEQSRRRTEDRLGTDLKLLAEGLRKTRMVRGFGMENFEHERFRGHLDRFLRKVASLKDDERWSRRLCWMVVLLAVLAVLFLIATKALADPSDPTHLPVSAVLLLVAAFRLAFRPLNELSELPHIEEQTGRWADNIQRFLDRIPEVGQAVGAKFLQPLAKQIQWESVTYRLPDRRLLLDRIDLRLPALKMYAVISLDPLESRALTYLLPRFIEPQSGRVLIDGDDLAFVTLDSLRAEALFVGGTDPVFTGTVAENIACGDARFTLQSVNNAAKEVHAHQFISKLPQGYETPLGEHGESLDAGQTFLLGLARALVRDPALIIIEEPAERLDEDTKSLLDDTYARLAKGRTLIFLPSRLSTVRKADQVILLLKGMIEAVGPYSKLITSVPLMRHWEYVRFNEFNRSEQLADT